MKVKVLGLIFVLVLWVFLNFSGEKASIQESDLPEELSPKTQIVDPATIHKIETHAPTESYSAPTISSDSVPWTDLEKRWQSELRDFLKGLDHENGDKLFNDYMKSQKDFHHQVKILTEKLNETYSYDEKEDKIIFKDKTKYKKLNEQVNDELIFHIRRTKKIFGSHYAQVNNYYLGFKDSIQAYHSGEGEIAIDPAFGIPQD